MDGLLRLSATELLAAYAARRVSPVEVVDALLAAIDERDGDLRAFLAVDPDGARAAARAAERAWLSGEPTPPLCGVPVSVKDSIEVAGMPTTYGSLLFAANQQPDAELVTRLRRAGAVIVGKTNLPEFALSPVTANRLGPPTRNPWDRERTAGGSSGGAAAAVAAGFGPLAVGTDSGGSVRLPAAYTGTFGLKPTFQRIPSVQRWRAAPGRSHNGPMSRTVADAALLMSVLAGPHPRDPDSQLVPPPEGWDVRPASLGGARVAVVASHSDDHHGGAVAAVREEAAAFFAAQGCEVVEAELPPWEAFRLDGGVVPYSGDHVAAAEELLPGFWARADELTDATRRIYSGGRTLLAWQYRQVLRHDQAYRSAVARWFESEDVDLVVMQGTGIAPPLDQTDDGIAPNALRDLVPFNMARNPAASVPWGTDPASGLPLALQVIGPLGADMAVLQTAALIEVARPWAHRWPPAAVTTPTPA
jgi:aspartyl-tRNA(Asn)/glutamyl-tRNA(Gln) amidotransferase subunit A